MTMRLAPAPFKYKNHNDMQIQLARGILSNVSALPGVQIGRDFHGRSAARQSIFHHALRGFPPVTPSKSPLANFFNVTPRFFETMACACCAAAPWMSVIRRVRRWSPW